MPDLDSVGKIIYDFTMPFKKIWKITYFKYIHTPPERKSVWEEKSGGIWMNNKNINSHIFHWHGPFFK